MNTHEPIEVDKRKSRGEATRKELLKATLAVIAQKGLESVTHRAVAAEAEMNLSLTTYHFKDLQHLINEAFKFYVARGRDHLDAQWLEFNAALSRYDFSDTNQHEAILDTLTDIATDYTWTQAQLFPESLKIEMVLLFAVHRDRELRTLALEYREYVLSHIADVCKKLGSHDANVDARLLLGTIQRLEYEAVTEPEIACRLDVEKQIRRHFTLLMGAAT
ncbi:MAG: TetR family transcriptional regulator [Cellvibrionaceae bacterium]